MNYKTHIAGGVTLGLMIYASSLIEMGTGPLIVASTCTGLVIGSVLPDIDHPNSFISKKAKITSFFTSKMFKHRTTTHSLVINSMFVGLLLLLTQNYSSVYFSKFVNALGTGILSHIILDMLTTGGVAIFYPITAKRFNLAKINVNKGKAGRLKENLIRAMLIAISISIIISHSSGIKVFLANL
jgi:inner membrane protein